MRLTFGRADACGHARPLASHAVDAPRLHVRRTRPCVALCVATSRELESSAASGKHGARGATWAQSGPQSVPNRDWGRRSGRRHGRRSGRQHGRRSGPEDRDGARCRMNSGSSPPHRNPTTGKKCTFHCRDSGRSQACGVEPVFERYVSVSALASRRPPRSLVAVRRVRGSP